MTPAFPMKMSIGAPSSRSVSPRAATDDSDDSSSDRSDTVVFGALSRIVVIAASPLQAFRTGRTRSAPAAASCVAMTSPIPSLPPVRTTRFPDRSGRVKGSVRRAM